MVTLSFLLWKELIGCSATRPFLTVKVVACETKMRTAHLVTLAVLFMTRIRPANITSQNLDPCMEGHAGSNTLSPKIVHIAISFIAD